MIRILKYWFDFIKEFVILYKYRKAALSLRKELEEAGLRVDNLGRIYTVINLKEELLTQPELMQQSFVLGQLGPITSILMKYGMADNSFPEISKIEGSSSYLVVCWPERDYVEFSAFFINLFVTLVVAAIIYAAIKYVPVNWLLETIQSYN